MKKVLPFICLLVILTGCGDENEESSLLGSGVYYDSLFLSSYESVQYLHLSEYDGLWVFYPKSNSVSVDFDVDRQGGNDFRIQISHDLYSNGPHDAYQEKEISITSLNESRFEIAAFSSENSVEVRTYEVGSTVNSNAYFSGSGDIVRAYAYSKPSICHTGNINLGIRKRGHSGRYDYGYINLYVGNAQIYLLKAKVDPSGRVCLVE